MQFKCSNIERVCYLTGKAPCNERYSRWNKRARVQNKRPRMSFGACSISWHLVLVFRTFFKKIGFSALQLSVSNHPLQYCEGKTEAGSWGGACSNFLWLYCYIIYICLKQHWILCCISLFPSAYSSRIFPGRGFTIPNIGWMKQHSPQYQNKGL